MCQVHTITAAFSCYAYYDTSGSHQRRGSVHGAGWRPFHIFSQRLTCATIHCQRNAQITFSLHFSERTLEHWGWPFNFTAHTHQPQVHLPLNARTRTVAFAQIRYLSFKRCGMFHHSLRQRTHLPPKSPGPPCPCRQPCILHSTPRDRQ